MSYRLLKKQRLISTQTANNSASIIITGLTSAYHHYRIEGMGVTAITAGSNLRALVSVDSGANWITTANSYQNGYFWSGSTSGSARAYATAAYAEILLAVDDGEDSHCFVDLYKFGQAYSPEGTVDSAIYANTGEIFVNTRVFSNSSVTAANAIKFEMSSGNIATGTFSLYVEETI